MFLTGTTNIDVGNGETFTIDYDALAAFLGTLDSYYGEKEVYREVLCTYQEQTSNATKPQRKTLIFRNGETTSQIVFSVKAKPGVWVLSNVHVKDKDGGDLSVAGHLIPDQELYELYISNN